jgi:hypothetical protein
MSQDLYRGIDVRLGHEIHDRVQRFIDQQTLDQNLIAYITATNRNSGRGSSSARFAVLPA